MSRPTESAVVPPARTGVPFVGRDPELGHIERAIAGLAAGHGGLILIRGEPGIGKSRLLEQARPLAERVGAVVLWGWCWQSSASIPLWPWRQMYREAVAHGLLDATVVSDQGRVDPDDGLDGELLPADRLKMFSDAADTLRELSMRRPVVVVIDDLHVADHASLLLLQFMANELTAWPVLLIGAYRRGDPALGEASQRVLDRLEMDGEVIDLAPLDDAAVRAAAEAVLGADAEQHVHRLVQASHGHPFVLMQHLSLLAADPEGGDPVDHVPLPAGVAAAITRRLDQLPRDTRHVLRLAAVCGLSSDARLLAELVGVSVSDVVERLGPAVAAQLVTALGGGRYRFEHVLVRDVAYEELSEAERLDAHLSLAHALAVPDGPASDLDVVVSHHLLRAVPLADGRQVVEQLRRAARHLGRTHAHEPAAELLVAALDVPVELSLEMRCDLWTQLGTARQRAAAEDADAAYLRAIELARRIGDERRFASAVLGLTEELRFARRDPTRLELLEEALDRVGSGERELRAQLLVRLVVERHSAKRFVDLDELSRDAMDAAEQVDEVAVRVAALEARRYALHHPRDVRERLEIDEQMVTLAQDVGDDRLVLRTRELRLLDLLEQGDGPTVRVEVEAFGLLADRLRLRFARAQSHFLRAMLALAEGRFEDAERMARRGYELGRAAQPRVARRTMEAQQLLTRRLRGGLDEFEPTVLAALAEFPAGYLPADAILAMYRAELGHRAEALRVLERSWPKLVERGDDGTAGPTFATFADAVILLGERDRAEDLIRLLSPWRGLAVVHGRGAVYGGAAAYHLGRLEALRGDRERAIDLLDEGIRLDRSMGAAVLVARGQLALAGVLLAGGHADRARARELLDEAEQTVRETRAARLGHAVRRLRSRVPGARAAAVSPPRETGSAWTFRREGEYWTVTFAGETARVRDRKGMRQIAELLRRPDQELRATWLAAVADERRPEPDDDPEHARVNVTRSIRSAIERLEQHLPALGDHLNRAIRTGASCRYEPPSGGGQTWSV